MHRAGIVREKNPAGCGHVHELGERCLAGEIPNFASARFDKRGDLPAEFAFIARAKHRHSGIQLMCKLDRRFREAFRQPAFCAAICRARRDADHFTHESKLAQAAETRLKMTIRGPQMNEIDGWNRVDKLRAEQHFQVVEPLMPMNLATFRDFNSVREEPSTAVAIVANSFWNSCQPGDGGCFKRILQKDDAIEFSAAQFRGRTPFRRQVFPPACGVVWNDLIY